MLTEDTEDHREIFGPEGENVLYFRDIGEMVEKPRWLLNSPTERQRLTAAARRLVTENRHRYEDRMADILTAVDD